MRYNIDNIFGKYLNDRDERATYVDGTSWYKVWWDSLDNSHSTSGTVKVDLCLADQIVPQPGITDWRQLEYILSFSKFLLRVYGTYIIDALHPLQVIRANLLVLTKRPT